MAEHRRRSKREKKRIKFNDFIYIHNYIIYIYWSTSSINTSYITHTKSNAHCLKNKFWTKYHKTGQIRRWLMYALYRCVIATGFEDHALVTTLDRISFNSVTSETFFDKTDYRKNMWWTRSLSAILSQVFLGPVDKPNERTSSVSFAMHQPSNIYVFRAVL